MRTKPVKGNPTLPMFTPTSLWKAPKISELPSWEGQKRVGIDTEFKDPTLKKLGLGARRGAKIAGYSFAFEDGRKWYVPVRHPEGNVECPVQAFNYIRDQGKHFKGELVGANLPVELDMFGTTENVEFPQVEFFRDVLVLDPLIYELHRSYSLESTSQRWGFAGKDEELLKRAAQDYGADISKPKTWKQIIPDLPAKYVGPYGEEDAFLPLPLLRKMEADLERQSLNGCWDLYSRALPVLVKLRRRGVRIDFDHLDKVEAWARKEERDALEHVYSVTSVRVCPGDTFKTNACVPVFTAIGVQVPMHRTDSGKMAYSLEAEFISGIDHPVAKSFLYARKMFKLYSTFVKSVRAHATNGRLHMTYRQIVGANDKNEKSGAAFGRLSCVNPNLSQQPSRAKYANFWRGIYVPEQGKIWGCLDYAAQEPRWTVHVAAMLGLPGARATAAEYRNNVKLDPHTFMANLTGLERTHAKTVFLGLCYGQGGAKLCRGLGLPTRWRVDYRENGSSEFFETKAQAVAARRDFNGDASFYEVAGEAGQAILDKFNERAPYVKLLAKQAEKKATKTGYVTVLGGRVIHFPMKDNGGYDWGYKALNRVIQGNAGLQMLQTLVTVDKEMPETFIQMTVYDELDGSFENIGEMKRVAKIMRESGGDLHVPMRIDIECGPNWGDLKQVCGEGPCEHFVDKKLEINGIKETYWCPEHARKLAA